MDICYYNKQLKEELDGAFEYIHKAIPLKKEHPNWATMYIKMAMAELDHASMIVKIFEEDYKILTTGMNPIPDYLSCIRSSILDMYSEFSSKIKYLHETYEAM